MTSEDNLFNINSGLYILRKVDGGHAIWQMKVKPDRGMFSFIILHYTFQDTDMERNMLLIDGQQNSVSLIVDVDQIGLQVFWKFFFVLIALDFAAIDILLLFEVTVEMLMTPFFKFLQFLYLQSTLMLISFLLVLQSFIRSLNDLSSPVSFNNIVA